MRKLNALLFPVLFVIATGCFVANGNSQVQGAQSKTLIISPSGEKAELSENCNGIGSGGCFLSLSVKSASGVTKSIWQDLGSLKYVSVEKTVYNGHYTLRNLDKWGKESTEYIWTGKKYEVRGDSVAAGQGDADASWRVYQYEVSQQRLDMCSPVMKRHAVIAGRLHVGQTQQQVKAILNSEGFDVLSVDGGSLRGRVAPGPWICKPLVGGSIAPGLHMVECQAYRNGVQEFDFDFRVSQTYRNPDTGELYQVKVNKLTQIIDQCSREH